MSYSVHAYLVPLERLQLVYGCHDRGVGQAIERTFATRLLRDETPEVVVIAESGALRARSEIKPPPVPTLRQDLYDIIAGTLRPDGDAAQYLYAMELFCAHLGPVLDNAAFIGINGIAIVAEFMGLEALVRHSRGYCWVVLMCLKAFRRWTLKGRDKGRSRAGGDVTVHPTEPTMAAVTESRATITLSSHQHPTESLVQRLISHYTILAGTGWSCRR